MSRLFTFHVTFPLHVAAEQLSTILGVLESMDARIQAIADAVAEQSTVCKSVEAFIANQDKQLGALRADLAAALANQGVNADELLAPLDDLRLQIKANSAELQAATVTNTVAEGTANEVPFRRFARNILRKNQRASGNGRFVNRLD